MPVQPQNPNYPVMQVLWSPTTNAVYDGNAPVYTDITLRLLQQWMVQRGKQYQLGLQQPGRFQSTINNRDGAFNPVSASSPFAPGVLPERSLVMRAQWPPGPNLLTADQATAGQASGITGAIPASMHIVTAMPGAPTIVEVADAWRGTNVYQQAVPANAGAFDLVGIAYVPIRASTIATPPTRYCFSAYCRSTTAGATPTVQGQLRWFSASGAQISISRGVSTVLAAGGSGTWTRVTVNDVPPAGALYALVYANLAGTTPSAAWTFQMNSPQLEWGTAPSAFAVPTWYPIYAGNVTRYPAGYDLSGTRALVKIAAADALGLLSRSVITGSLAGLIANPAGDNSVAGAVFDYWLGDANDNQYTDQLGLRTYGQGLPGKYGIGTITAGVPVTSTTPGMTFLGSVQTCTSFAAPGGPGGAVGAAMSAIALPPGPNGQLGPGGGTNLGFTRMIAFKCTQAPPAGSLSALWSTDTLDNLGLGVLLDEFAQVVVTVEDAGHTSPIPVAVGTYTVGDWHLAWLGVAADGSSYLAGVDDTVTSYAAGATDYTWSGLPTYSDVLGANPPNVMSVHALNQNFQGDLALLVEWPELLTPAVIASIYSAWRTGYAGDSSGARAGHILDWSRYLGPRAIDAGATASLGAATDVVQTDAVTALQDVVATEGGRHFIARDGTYALYSRNRRLGAYVPVYTFGTDVAAGEIPFEDVQPDFDDTQVTNNISNTQASTLQTFYSVNEDSVARFGASTLMSSNQSSNAQEVQDQADWYAGVNGYPRMRIASLTLHPSANPDLLWPVCLSLELGMYVRVVQRPMGAAVGALDPVAVQGFVENIAISGQQSDARWVLQISPDVASGGGPSQPALNPWILALLHTTLNQPAAAGTNVITIDALPTAATSTLAQNLPQGGAGMNFVVGSNLATQETLVIQSVSATVVGYTTATITFATNLANNHAAKEIVREPLGNADFHSWQSLDAYSTLGTCMIAY